MKLPSDPFVLELLPEFVQDWLEKLDDEYHKYFATKDAESMYRFAHTIKGSSYQFGFDELGDLGVEMMTQVKSNDWEGLEQNIETFRKKLIEIRDYINNSKD